MFRIIYQPHGNNPQALHNGQFETEAQAEAEARSMLEENGDTYESVIVLRPVAEFHITKTITMKEWKQMLKDQADG